MTDYSLKYRVLSDEERLLLLGADNSKYQIKIIKAKNLENYLELFERIYKGYETILPEFINETDPIRVYIYCGNPAGSKVYADGSWKKSSFVYETPSSYTKYYANNLFLPAIKEATSLFTNQEIQEASTLYKNVASSYSSFFETLQSGMFLNLYKGKIISATSYKAFAFQASDRVTSVETLPKDELATIYNKLTFALPTNVVKYFIPEDLILPYEFLHYTSSFILKRTQLILSLTSLFSWTETSSIVIGPEFLQLAGFTYTDNKVYTLLGAFTSTSPLNSSHNLSSFTKAFETAITSEILGDAPCIGQVFEFSNAHKQAYYSSHTNSGSFIFINSDNLSTTPISRSLGVEEYVELNPEFIESVKQIYIDEGSATFTSNNLKEKFLKTEFAMKSEALISEIESINKRYIPIKNKDKKIILLNKTSIAKETAKKTAITRKISTAMTPVIDIAVRLFSIRDFETGYANKKYNFKFLALDALNMSTKYASGNDLFNTLLDSNSSNKITTDSKLFKEFIRQMTEFNSTHSSKPLTLSKSVISDIYEDTSYDGTPFIDLFKPSSYQYYRTSFNRLSEFQQTTNIFNYLVSGFYDSFFKNLSENTGYFSPASGMLNIYKLGYSLYTDAKEYYFKPETKYVYSEFANSLTGKLLYYLYSNNFISTDQNQSDQIEDRKTDDYISLSNSLIPYSNCFSYQQDALDTFVALKKSRTFTDYYSWFKNVRPTLETISKDLFANEELATHELNKLFFNQSELLLQQLALSEIPYIKIETPKKRGRKTKEATQVVEINTIIKETITANEGEKSGESGTTN